MDNISIAKYLNIGLNNPNQRFELKYESKSSGVKTRIISHIELAQGEYSDPKRFFQAYDMTYRKMVRTFYRERIISIEPFNGILVECKNSEEDRDYLKFENDAKPEFINYWINIKKLDYKSVQII